MIEAATAHFVYEIDADNSDEVLERLARFFEQLSADIVDANDAVPDRDLNELDHRSVFSLMALSEAVHGFDDDTKALVFTIVEDLIRQARDGSVLAANDRQCVQESLKRRGSTQGALMRDGKKRKAEDRDKLIHALIDANVPAKAIVAECSKQGFKIDVSNVYRRRK